MKAGKTGVTSGTPKNILFGAGTIHKKTGTGPHKNAPSAPAGHV